MFRLTCVSNNVALSMVSSNVKEALRLDFPAPVVVVETQEVAEGSGLSLLPVQEHEVVKAVPEERVPKRIVEQIARSVPVDLVDDSEESRVQ